MKNGARADFGLWTLDLGLRRRHHPRRGTMIVLVAVCLVAIVGIVALTLDGGSLFQERRSVQASADAAALAAAADLFKNYNKNNGLDPSGTAKASALSTAKANGFNNDGTTNTVTVNIPPASGIASGKSCYAEVIIQANENRAFSAIFGSGTVPVQCRAVTYGHPAGIGVYCLHTSGASALDVNGNVEVLDDAAIQVNSSDNDAVDVSSLGNLTCGGIYVVGKAQNCGTISYTDGGSLSQGATSVADPLASIPEPTSFGTNYGDHTCTVDGTIQPGTYHNLTINQTVDVTMASGTYNISGGINFQAPGPGKAAGTLSGSGVMIYNSSGDHLNFQNAGNVNLSAPTSGTYQGIVLWEPRASNQQIHIESNNNITLAGTIYSQAGFFDMRPDGASTVFYFGSYVCDQIELCDGNDQKSKSNGTVIFDPSVGSTSISRPKLVE